jgi:hypothetical protein
MGSGLTRAVPKNIGELRDNLHTLFKNKSHVVGVEVNPSTGHLEIKLDGSAHFFGKPDFYMPIRSGKINDAQAIVRKITGEINQGTEPSDSDVQALFDLIDQQGS